MAVLARAASTSRIVVDRPRDRWIWSRAELVAGWCEVPRDRPFPLEARCGARALTVGQCPHPDAIGDPGRTGFWTILVLQEHLDALEGHVLPVDFFADGAYLRTVRLRVSPLAVECARAYPLDVGLYPVSPAPRSPGGAAPVATVVFPGLGAAGGSSLGMLVRRHMLRTGCAVPVYDEPNAPELWQRLVADVPAARFRWIDGHGCYHALPRPDGSAARVTVLREPCVRTLSVFSYRSLVHPQDLAADTLEAFVESGEAWDASQAVGLLRLAGITVDRRMSAAETYTLAREELARSYRLVGVAERFEETIFLLARLAGYDTVGMWWRILAAPRLVALDDLTARTRAGLERALEADRRLYDDARRALAGAVASAAFGDDLGRYREAARREVELPASLKAVECLRWRQVLADGALAAARWQMDQLARRQPARSHD